MSAVAEDKKIVVGGSFLIEERTPEEVFTPEDFTEEHRMIADTARQFMDNEVRPRIDDLEKKDWKLARELVQKGAELGFIGATVPEEYGGLGLDESACESLVSVIDRAHAERNIWCGPDAQAPRVLEELGREGLRLAVISNTEDGRARDALEAAGLASYFDVVIDSHLVGCKKPDPAIFRLALERLGVEASEAAFVGDSYALDALAARAVGMRAILLDPLGLHPESVCPRIESLGDLLRGEV